MQIHLKFKDNEEFDLWNIFTYFRILGRLFMYQRFPTVFKKWDSINQNLTKV